MDIELLPLVGGDWALDLVNTVERGVPAPGAAPRDFLAAPGDLWAWAQRVELLSSDEAADVERVWSAGGDSDVSSLRRIRGLREAVHLIVLAQLGETSWEGGEISSALDLVGRRSAQAGARSRLRPGRDGRTLIREVGPEPAHLIDDRLAEAALALLTGTLATRIRRCPIEQGGCGWVFLDHSRNSSRTWCRMADCGNQVKAQRLTERRRQLRKDQRSTESR